MIVDLLMQFGAREPSGDGTQTVYFDKQARKRLHSYSGGLMRKLSDELDAYAVVAGDRVVTVGTRYKRILRA